MSGWMGGWVWGANMAEVWLGGQRGSWRNGQRWLGKYMVRQMIYMVKPSEFLTEFLHCLNVDVAIPPGLCECSLSTSLPPLPPSPSLLYPSLIVLGTYCVLYNDAARLLQAGLELCEHTQDAGLPGDEKRRG